MTLSQRTFRLGTRASALARWQAHWVAGQFAARGIAVELVPMTTSGDRLQTSTAPIPIAATGMGIFTKEIQKALLADEVDLAVHSLKDLPTEKVPGLMLAAVPVRASVADVLVSSQADSIEGLRPQAIVGTGSLRRRAQLLHLRPDLVVTDLRGNVDTRLSKLERGDYDAIILAEAGLERLGLAEASRYPIPLEKMLPAIGQGALGIECREDDEATRRALAIIDDSPSHRAVLAERAMLTALHGGCMAPIGGWACIVGESLVLSGRVLSTDGRECLDAKQPGSLNHPEALGRIVAQDPPPPGAARLIDAARFAS